MRLPRRHLYREKEVQVNPMLANQAHAVDGGEASRLPFRHQWPAATEAQR